MKKKDFFEAIISSMGRKKIINVPAKSEFKMGDKVKVERVVSWWAKGEGKEPPKRESSRRGEQG